MARKDNSGAGIALCVMIGVVALTSTFILAKAVLTLAWRAATVGRNDHG